MSLPLLLLLNLSFSAMLTGLIWLVQLVQYPGFKLIGKNECLTYQQHHVSKISWVVVPLMLGELLFASWLLLTPFTFSIMEYLNYAAFGCVLVVWLVTFGWEVPTHKKLEKEGYKKDLLQKLIRLNWFRTIGWTLRTIILFLLILLYV